MKQTSFDFFDMLPGDRIDPDEMDPSELKELELSGYVISTRGILGCIEMCPTCEGDGIVVSNGNEKGCRDCDGSGNVVDFGEGMEPWNG